jgi:hypothetical protein
LIIPQQSIPLMINMLSLQDPFADAETSVESTIIAMALLSERLNCWTCLLQIRKIGPG